MIDMIPSAMAQERPARAPADKASPAPSALDKVNAEIKSKQQELVAQQAPQGPGTWWTTTSAMTMSATVLVFGLATLCLAAYVIRKGHPWEAVLKIFGMVLIVVLTVFLIVAGYDDKQIAPAVGLLGTIAGYLLGKDVTPAQRPQQAGGTGAAAPAPAAPPAKGGVS